MTPAQIDKAASLYRKGTKLSKVAQRLRADPEDLRSELAKRGMIFKRPIAVELRLKGIPKWCAERLASAAQHRQISSAEELASLILISRLARGSIDADLRGVALRRPGPYRTSLKLKR